jgi:hypothetical protein
MSTWRTVAVTATSKRHQATPNTIRVPRTLLDDPVRTSANPLLNLLTGALGWTAIRLMSGLIQLNRQLSR